LRARNCSVRSICYSAAATSGAFSETDVVLGEGLASNVATAL